MAGIMQMMMAGGGGAGFRHYRVYVTANNGDANHTAISEIEFRNAAGTDLTTGRTATASSSYVSNPANYAIDDIDTTAQSWATAVGVAVPVWWAVDLGSAQAAKDVRIWPQSGWTSRSPKDFKIQGSNDAAAWSDIATFTNVTGWSNGTPKVFSL